MTQILKNIFGLPEKIPYCSSRLWRSLPSSDGSLRRLQIPCPSQHRCDVCQYRRAKKIRGFFSCVNNLPADMPVSFVTLTVDPKKVNSTDPQVVAEYGKKQFGSFRRNHLSGKNVYWARVFEYGKKKSRFHIHLLIAGDHPFAPVSRVSTKREWVKNLSPAARNTYDLLLRYGLGMYHAEVMRSHAGALNYLTKYVAKSTINESLVRDVRLVGCSSNWPRKKMAYDKRLCYKAGRFHVDGAPGSDLLVPQLTQIHPMLHNATVAADIDFQLAGFRYNRRFWRYVSRIADMRALIVKSAAPILRDRRRVLRKYGLPVNEIERQYVDARVKYSRYWVLLSELFGFSGSKRFLTLAASYPEVFETRDYSRFIPAFLSRHPIISL